MNYLVQQICIGPTNPATGQAQCVGGPIPTKVDTPGVAEINTLGDLVNKVVQFLVPFAVIILFLVFIWGGYDYLLSRGNPEKMKGAQAKLTAGVIGFILLAISYFIVKLLSSIFGLGEGIL